MWTLEKIDSYLRENLKEQRYIHSLGVRDSAILLASLYGENTKKAEIAGLVHDCAKNLKNEELLNMAVNSGIYLDSVSKMEPQLLHGLCGSIIAEKSMGISDKYILDSIIYHTTGRENMTRLDKIIYLADYIEPSRNFQEVNYLRNLSYIDLDKAMLYAFDITIKYIISKEKLLHMETIKGRNYILQRIR
jgi:predicted HD superfamily hydrolase involved in NAD metabolism